MSTLDAQSRDGRPRQFGGRYRLVRYIASGGMAEVWEGHDAVLSRPVAIKVLLAHLATDHTVLERFRREAVTAAGLAHPGVIATYDTGVDHGTAWIVMELVRGRTLRQLMTERGAMDPALVLRIAVQITDALAHAHRTGLVHRDIKPGNVLLSEDEGPVPRAKVADFGIAKAAEGLGLDLTRPGIVLGTPKYLSPEQVEGIEPDPRSDLYSLGVVLFEMLTGRPPFCGPTDMATALAHLREPPPRVSDARGDVPGEIVDIVAGLLVKDRQQRTPSATALRRELTTAARHLGEGHPRTPLPTPTAVMARSRTEPVMARPPAPLPLPSGGRDDPAVGPRRRSRPARPTRRGPGLVVASLVVAGVVVLGMLVAHTHPAAGTAGGKATTGVAARGPSLPIVHASEFILYGRPEDNPSDLQKVYDGNPATMWSTGLYRSSQFGGYYPGMGVVIQLDRPRSVHLLTVTSSTPGWSAQAYVSSHLPLPLAPPPTAWGPPTGALTMDKTIGTISLGGHRGSYVMLWLTDLGPLDLQLPDGSYRARVTIAELSVG